MTRPVVVVDFETYPVGPRPDYPPEPVGVSIWRPGERRATYHAWGHPTENNTTRERAVAALKEVWGGPLLFHHAHFDLAVAEEKLGLPLPPVENVHDTLPLLFLDDPHQLNLSLKPSAERLLGMAPTERDAVGDWLRAHAHENPAFANRYGKLTKKSATASFTAYAPGKLAGAYANGDVLRTRRLFELLVKKHDGPAYRREIALNPALLAMERPGIRVDVERLRTDVARYQAAREALDAYLRRRLKSPDLNVDAGPQLAVALLAAGLADEAALGVTEKTGQPQSNADAFERAVTDPGLLALLKYRGRLATYLGTFLEAWLRTAERSGGFIYTYWSSVRNAEKEGGKLAGARTGRLASSPNFQNVPKNPAPLFREHAALLSAAALDALGLDAKAVRRLPASPVRNLPPLPWPRTYVVPYSKDHVLVDRDYNQQELRILAHYEDGGLAAAYAADPWMDAHTFAQKLINSTLGTNYPRKHIKNTGFGILYGMGLDALAEKCETTYDEAAGLRKSYLGLLHDVKGIIDELKRRAGLGEPLVTWGGRSYYCEPPRLVNGRMRDFAYKLINYLIQGSAGDCTKEALLAYTEATRGTEDVFHLTVHDEFLASVPRKDVKRSMQRLRTAMEGVRFDVPMLSEGTFGTSWGEMREFDVRGKIVARGVR